MSETAAHWANALYELTQDERGLRKTCGALMGVDVLWDALTSPVVKPREKDAVLDRLPFFGDCPVLLHFCKLLADKGRIALLPEIVSQFHALALEDRNAATCIMTCVRVPDADQQELLKKLLCKKYHKAEILLEIRLDPALLGGFTLELLGFVCDKSVRGQLNDLARHLQGR